MPTIRQARPPAVQAIFAKVAAVYGIHQSKIISGSRRIPLPDARAEVAWSLRYALKRPLSLSQIGSYLHRDHTAVLAMLRRYDRVRKHRSQCELRPEFAPEFGVQIPVPAEPFDPGKADLSGEWAI